MCAMYGFPRHILTAANCLCSTDWRYNIFGKYDPRNCRTEYARNKFVHHNS